MKNYFSVAILLSLACSCQAQNGLKTKEVFMYKNGFTYVHSEGKVSTTDGVWSLNEKEIPDALFGTFWFQSPGGIQYIARQIDSVVKPMLVPGLEHLLAANVGKKVKLTLGSESSSQLLEG